MEYRRDDQKSTEIVKEQLKTDNEDYIVEGLNQE